MDINLTGQIAAFGFGAFLAGIFSLAAVMMTNRNAERRDKQNRKNEALWIQREERKQAYIQYIKYVVKTDVGNRSQNSEPAIDVKKYVDEHAGAIAALKLLSPKIANLIIDMHNKYLSEDEAKFPEEWKKLSNEFYTEIIPLMQVELASPLCACIGDDT